jgi:hypothetical protein
VAGLWPQPFIDAAFKAAQSLLGLAPAAAGAAPSA